MAGQCRGRLRALGTGRQQLVAVVADVGELLEAEDPASVERLAAADDRREAVAGGDPLDELTRPAGTAASSGRSTIGASVPSRSRNTAELRGSSASGATAEKISGGPALAALTPRSYSDPASARGLDHRRVQADRIIKLAVIGVLAGAFSALFGVGGGVVIVPLLIFWLGYGERRATATSLCAIVVIGAFAAAGQGLYGNVDVGDAALLAGPAIVGVALGVALQQRIPERVVSLLFAAAALRRRRRADRPVSEVDRHG